MLRERYESYYSIVYSYRIILKNHIAVHLFMLMYTLVLTNILRAWLICDSDKKSNIWYYI